VVNLNDYKARRWPAATEPIHLDDDGPWAIRLGQAVTAYGSTTSLAKYLPTILTYRKPKWQS